MLKNSFHGCSLEILFLFCKSLCPGRCIATRLTESPSALVSGLNTLAMSWPQQYFVLYLLWTISENKAQNIFEAKTLPGYSKCIRTVVAHDGTVQGMCFHPNGEYFFSVSKDALHFYQMNAC